MSINIVKTPFAESKVWIPEKLYWDITDQSDLYNSWVTANGDDDIDIPISGSQALTVHFPMNFIEGWPADPAFVTKGSGACLRNYVNGTGGFCMIESNNSMTQRPQYGYVYLDQSDQSYTPWVDAGADAENWPDAYDSSRVYNAEGRQIHFYRLEHEQFAALQAAWDDENLQVSESGIKDTRCFAKYLDENALYIDTSYSGLVEGIHYPDCELDETENIWSCAMFLSGPDNGLNMYPALADESKVSGIFIAGYL